MKRKKLFIILVLAVVLFSSYIFYDFFIEEIFWKYNNIRTVSYINDGVVDIAFVFFYESGNYTNWKDVITKSFFESSLNSPLSVYDFFKQYINYEWNLTFYEHEFKYSLDYYKDVYMGIDEWYITFNKSVEIYNTADILIFITPLTGITTFTIFTSNDFYYTPPAPYDRITSFKYTLAHEILHWFGAKDKYSYVYSNEWWYNTDIMAMGDFYSFHTQHYPPIIATDAHPEIHWNYTDFLAHPPPR
jgi:hypothetical protein